MLVVMGRHFEIVKGDFGVETIRAEDLRSLMTGLGYLHARDRGLQMLTNRIAFTGRICELLKDSEETLNIDVLMSTLDLIESSKKDLSFLPEEDMDFLEAYCDGVNGFFEQKGRPWLHRLLRIKYEKWLPHHTLALMKLSTFLGLAQSQIELETWLIELIQKGANFEKIKSVVHPFVQEYDEENLERIRSAHFDFDFTPAVLPFELPHQGLHASNNWAIAQEKSIDGGPIHCFDPHLDCLRVPTMWYEVKLELKGELFAGISVAGIPGIVMGKSPKTAMSFTYGYMDMVDFFIEDIKDGQYLFENTRLDPKLTQKTIKRKKHDDLEVTSIEGAAGPLWIDPRKSHTPEALSDGYYFSWAWSGRNGVHTTVQALKSFFSANNAKELQESIKRVSFSCNWILTDNQNNLIFQQSGRFPNRKAEGLLPQVAWHKDNLWSGLQELEQLVSYANPACGFISSANNFINKDPLRPTINACKGNYRNDRIQEMLQSHDKLSIDDMKNMQNDVFSIKAKTVLEKLTPYFPNSSFMVNLKGWDCRYDSNSKTPHLFEVIYFRLNKELFGREFKGAQNWEHFIENTPMYGNFHNNFDRILLAPTEAELSLWYGEEGYENWMRARLKKIIKELSLEEFKFLRWKELRTFQVQNSLMPEFLRKWFKLDSEPTVFSGCPDAINQSTVMQRGTYKISSSASYRGIINHEKKSMLSILPGGNSEKKGAHYLDQLRMWELGKYKELINESDSTVTSDKNLH